MKRLLTSTYLAALAALASSTTGNWAATPPKASMSIKVLSVTAPRVITRKHQLILVHVRYTGIQMDPLHIGKKPAARHGHMQVYLDRIPSSAYKNGNTASVVATAASAAFNIVLLPHWRKAAHGHHRFLVALARNDDILYRVNPGSFSLTVK